MSIFKKLYNVTYFIKIEFIAHCIFRYLKDNYVFFHGFYMPIVNVKKLDNILSKLIETKRIPKIILIGYKSYSELMKDRKFFEDVVGSSMKPSKRTYKNIKIKVTQDDNQLEVRCFSWIFENSINIKLKWVCLFFKLRAIIDQNIVLVSYSNE